MLDVNNTKNSNDEKFYFKILYFIAIIMVVERHCNMGELSLFNYWFDGSSFILGIFMFTSGYFFIKNLNKKTTNIILNKLKKIIIPLYVWNVVYGILVFLLKSIKLIKFGGNLNLVNLIVNPIYSAHAFLFNKGSWFLFPLFTIQIISILFIPILKKKLGPYIVFVLYFFLGMMGVQLAILGYNTEWWLVLTRILYFLPYFGLGILYKEKLEKHDKLNNFLYFSIILIIQLCLIYIKGGKEVYVPFECLNFTDIISPFIFGFIGLAFWLRLSKILEPSLKESKVIKLISNNTFSIMMHHMLGFFVLNLVWYIFAKNFSFIEGFSFDIFKSNISYRYLPKDLGQFKILYLFFGLAIPLIITYYMNKTKIYLSKYLNIHKIKRQIRLKKVEYEKKHCIKR